MRGSMFDMIFIPVLIVVILLSGIFTLYIGRTVQDAVEVKLRAETDVESSDYDKVFGGANTALDVASGTMPTICFFLYIASLITSYLTKNHPIFIFFSVLFLAIGIILTVITKQIYDAVVTADLSFGSQVTMSTWYFNNSTIILAIFGALNIFLMYYGYMQTGRD